MKQHLINIITEHLENENAYICTHMNNVNLDGYIDVNNLADVIIEEIKNQVLTLLYNKEDFPV